MKNTIVYITDPKIPGGGFADRITGMALLFKISISFNCNFKIHFKHPFDFFELFPNKLIDHKFDQNLLQPSNSNHNSKIFNLIDENFAQGIDQLCKALIQEEGMTAFVFINTIKSFIFDPIFNKFIEINHSQDDTDEIERSVLYEFGEQFLEPRLDLFSKDVQELLPQFHKKTIGIQIRLGGNNPDWIDPNFRTPDISSILLKLDQLKESFDQIFLCSDNITYKNNILHGISVNWKTITLDEAPLHLERSSNEHSNFISRTLGDHILLRKCSAGIIICGGGYGRTAAIISQKPYFRV